MRRLVTAAQRGVSRGERLTRQLLAFSRQRPLQMHTVNVNAALAEFAPFVQRALGEAINLRLELGKGEWLCDLDPAQFEAAILNLAINARDAIDGSGTLTIATSRIESAADIVGRPPELPDRPCVVVTVSDTGSGMSPETLRRVFEPFYTTKAVGKGSGLGLAQVWGFVTQSGGWAGVESALGRGTIFRLYLPLSAATHAEADPDERIAGHRTITGGSEAILIVEDEEDVREVAAATLRQLGYRTTVARDGRIALELLRGGCEADLLFSDYVMPNGLNGAELAREAVQCRPGLKVLLTSGYVRQGAPDGDDFTIIEKPYRVADLAARIRQLLGDRARPAA